MTRDDKALAAIAAGVALAQALQTHVSSAGQQQRKASIRVAEVKLKRLRMVCDPSLPFTWSLHHDGQFIDAHRKTKANIKMLLREMAQRMQDGQSAIDAGMDAADLLCMRYLALFGGMIGRPELAIEFAEYEDS